MNWQSILLLLLIAALVILAIGHIARHRGCSCGCDGCARHCSNRRKR
ncbi:MAG: FeoB-associated Cys-rich membrane protein [Oscillospiraceae bacterium]|nr:FeoB-associated Cys-rich membrane protein [Oscillospiraceae bacterium]